ncbi:MAG TPA: hypothetical protein VGJ32_00375 [Solirubrobacteraceae bacterium]|jgi:hypothetical protein
MERVWASRLRWRLRGATQWPAFALFVAADAVLLHLLPIAGDGPDLFSAVLLSGFFNLLVVAVAAPLAGRALRVRRHDLPQIVAGDLAGTVLLAVLAAGLVGLGLAHRAQARADREAVAEGVRRARAYVERNGEPQYRRRVGEATTLRFGEDLMRTCVPGDDPDRWMCVFVFTDQDPPGLREDTNRAPNSSWFPPDRGG